MSEQAGSNFQGQGEPKIPQYKPGTQKVHIKVLQEKRAGSEVVFTHDLSAGTRIADAFTNATFGSHEMLSHNPLDVEEWHLLNVRMVSALIAKKLATALAPEQGGFSYGLKPISRIQVSAPLALVTLAQGFGYVNSEVSDCVMLGQPSLAMTYAGRAFYRNLGGGGMNVDPETTIFINMKDPQWKEIILDWCRGVVRAWSQTCDPYMLTVGNAQVEISVPFLVNGFATYQVLTQNVERSVQVQRALTIGAFIEGVNDLGPAQIDALVAMDVCVVNWGASEFSRMEQQYIRNVQAKLEGTLSMITNWGPVSTMSNFGSTWQLLRKETEACITSMHKITGKDLEFGWMLAGDVSAVVRDNPYAMTTQERTDVGVKRYMDQAMRKKF